MIKFKNTQITAVLLTSGLFGWTCTPAAADVRIEGRFRRAVGRSPIPLSPYGPQVQASPSNWPKQNQAAMADLSFSAKKLTARM